MASAPAPEVLRFTTHKSLSHRLVLSALTGRPIHISQIRSSSPTNPGLAPHEISFLRLLESISNGSSVQISYTGTQLVYNPGVIAGSIDGLGADVDGVIKCHLPASNTRGISYFLLPLCMLAPFAKKPVNVRFEGEGVITSSTEAGDISVDNRSCPGPGGKGGGGVVELRFGSQIKGLPKTLHLNRSPGRVRRIRGVAYATGVSNSHNARMIHEARGVLNPFVGDIHIATQYDQAPLVSAKDKTNPSAKKRTGVGFGLALIAETSSAGVVYSADVVSPSEGGVAPEDIGKQCAYQLLEIISQGGCVTKAGAPTVLTLMAMGSEDVGRLRLGREVVATEDIIGLGRDLKKFGASSWGLRDVEEDESDDIIVSVKGTGVGNVGRGIQ
ncbi:hypothetical protein ACMFMF_000665 [Clarireedia jacksonii]